MTNKPIKPLGSKAYGHIPHIRGSRMGNGDHRCPDGQSDICTVQVRDKHDRVIVQEKLDGSCVAVAKLGGEIVPLIRAGYPAANSNWEQHHLFNAWAWQNRLRFLNLLQDGERVVGEWLAQAHGTRYKINVLFEPFQAFDIMRGTERATFDEFVERICTMGAPFSTPSLLCYGPVKTEAAIAKIANPWSLDQPEGVVYRVERLGKVDFLAKYVRPEKVDGLYLPEISGKPPVWNWRPSA